MPEEKEEDIGEPEIDDLAEEDAMIRVKISEEVGLLHADAI